MSSGEARATMLTENRSYPITTPNLKLPPHGHHERPLPTPIDPTHRVPGHPVVDNVVSRHARGRQLGGYHRRLEEHVALGCGVEDAREGGARRAEKGIHRPHSGYSNTKSGVRWFGAAAGLLLVAATIIES